MPAELMTKANVVVSILPNVGSNDFAYLRHVVTHWHSLAPLLVLCEAGEPSKCSADAVLRPSGTPPVLAAFGVANENSDMMSKGLVKPRQDAAKVFKFSMSMREAYAFRSNTGTSYPLVGLRKLPRVAAQHVRASADRLARPELRTHRVRRLLLRRERVAASAAPRALRLSRRAAASPECRGVLATAASPDSLYMIYARS